MPSRSSADRLKCWKRQEEANEIPAKDARPTSAVPQYVQRQFKDIQTLKHQQQLEAEGADDPSVQGEHGTRPAHPRLCGLRDKVPRIHRPIDCLELLIKNHILEQTNVEELKLQIQEKTLNDLQSLVIASVSR
jgi:hypothetical protein